MKCSSLQYCLRRRSRPQALSASTDRSALVRILVKKASAVIQRASLLGFSRVAALRHIRLGKTCPDHAALPASSVTSEMLALRRRVTAASMPFTVRPGCPSPGHAAPDRPGRYLLGSAKRRSTPAALTPAGKPILASLLPRLQSAAAASLWSRRLPFRQRALGGSAAGRR